MPQEHANRRNAWQFRLHLELIDFGDFGSELDDDFSQFCGKSPAAQRAVTFEAVLIDSNDLIFDSRVLPRICMTLIMYNVSGFEKGEHP
jgi:hypothetical protein